MRGARSRGERITAARNRETDDNRDEESPGCRRHTASIGRSATRMNGPIEYRGRRQITLPGYVQHGGRRRRCRLPAPPDTPGTDCGEYPPPTRAGFVISGAVYES